MRVDKEIEALIDEDEDEDESKFNINGIEVGDYVDFGPYGKLYVNVVDVGGHSRVTDIKADRANPDASGWYINLNLAERMLQKYQDVLDDDDEYGEDENEETGGEYGDMGDDAI